MSTLREAVLGLDDPVSVYCEWVRLQMASFYSLFVVYVKLLILGISYDPTEVRASGLSGRSGLRTPGPNATTYPLLLIVVPIIMKGVFFVVIKRESIPWAPIIDRHQSSAASYLVLFECVFPDVWAIKFLWMVMQTKGFLYLYGTSDEVLIYFFGTSEKFISHVVKYVTFFSCFEERCSFSAFFLRLPIIGGPWI